VDDVDDNCPLVYGEDGSGCPVPVTACPCWAADDMLQFNSGFCYANSPWVHINDGQLAYEVGISVAAEFYYCRIQVSSVTQSDEYLSLAEGVFCANQIADRCSAIGLPITPFWPTSEPASSSARK